MILSWLKIASQSFGRISQRSSVLLCYSLGWVSGIIMLLIKGNDSVVRFHAWQSTILFGILTIPITVLNMITIADSILYWVLVALYWIVIYFSLYIWITLLFKDYKGKYLKLPVVGTLAISFSGAWHQRKIINKDVGTVVLAGQSSAVTLKSPADTGHIHPEFTGLSPLLRETIKSLITLHDIRDPYTSMHQQKVAELACAIARKMGFPSDRIEGINVMACLHDIGKVAVPAEILSKPGKLTDYEFGIIRSHPEVAGKVLNGLEFPWPVAEAILQHHERYNGTGYPRGVANGNTIPEARILAVADVIEAMSSHRPYRPALGVTSALNEISANSGVLYDTNVVSACLSLFNEDHFKFS